MAAPAALPDWLDVLDDNAHPLAPGVAHYQLPPEPEDAGFLDLASLVPDGDVMPV